MQNIIDLAAERTQRGHLAQQAAEGGELFTAGLQLAGQTLANLAWVLAAPVRHHDKELKEGIYELVLARLDRIITGAMEDMDHAPHIKHQVVEQAKNAAFAAFKMHLLTLAAAEQAGNPAP
ncbi:hypothetical protein P7D22_13410 [Lichenihabitans sp. Uapishka_5]|uniref:hypothetical protein n=1 Tax=Lichenihabitans sp. Uapishka_5 TaxID=3037302 RepID=UPI0029E81914|nr:hypothetical protein [Lichenihabitans sp. Uapishka_5]MDX7952173.1 hypothetical protein [Lichenihabitans sp. Uapishka_5]